MESLYVSTGTELVELVQTIRFPLLDWLFLWLTRLGEAPILIGASLAALAIYRRSPWIGVGMLVAFGLSSLINDQIKEVLEVPRPSSADVYTAQSSDSNSTPSAHTMSAAAVWFFLALSMAKGWWRLPVVGIPFVVGFTRVYLGMHYPGDVALGLGLGALIAAGLWLPGHLAVMGERLGFRSRLAMSEEAPQGRVSHLLGG